MGDPDDPRFHAARLVLALRQAGVMDQRVLEALEKTAREPFVPRPFLGSAWDDVELPIDCGQSLTRPVVVGVMVQALNSQREHLVLEIGSGTGYSAAVLSRLSRRVYTIERYRTLVEKARGALDQIGIERVEVRLADGLLGWPEAAPFDRVVLMGAVVAVPPAIVDQVARGGVIVAPIDRDGAQHVVRIEKRYDGSLHETVVLRARFALLEPGIAREL
ncbi:MAG: protein-L-isoaspartate(D-aspartate) O-methyltransferase [Alphaproteobacteria bacterium]|nr:protein-L-isoaspartate(D-aspartate) O-methyltransferase [Alphaproteobacteria bacterium]